MQGYWHSERAEFLAYLADHPASDYRDWQPTKWQSLLGVREKITAHAVDADHPIKRALELGCGSATLLLQFALEGVEVRGIDRSPIAIQLARDAAESLGCVQAPVGKVTFFQLDFQTARLDIEDLADLVLSMGVIEHFAPDTQRSVMERHGSLSKKWVLIGIPNMGSPLFQSFLRAKSAQNRLYDDKHYPIDVPAVAQACGYSVAIADGCHLFLSRQDDLRHADGALLEFYSMLRDQLLMRGGARFAQFPRMDLTASDIDVLRVVEKATPIQLRMRFGFMLWYLLDVTTGASSTRG